jgi:hypothetical protein
MEEKERALKIAAELSAAERHFNSMQNHCRTMASTWLLAGFGAIGFIHFQKPDQDSLLAADQTSLFAAAVAIAAAFGIFFLWVLDAKVWHRLLLANYEEGRLLEQQNTFLPQVRKRMRESQAWWPVRVHISVFYAGGVGLLLVIAGFYLRWQLQKTLPDWANAGFYLVGVGAIVLVVFMIVSARNSHSTVQQRRRRPKASPNAAT